jgi:hypothetical protein
MWHGYELDVKEDRSLDHIVRPDAPYKERHHHHSSTDEVHAYADEDLNDVSRRHVLIANVSFKLCFTYAYRFRILWGGRI